MTPTEFPDLLPHLPGDYAYDPTSSADDYPDLNLTDVFCDKQWLRRAARHFLPPVYWLVFLVGTAGNGLVLLVRCAARARGRSAADAFLLSLAAADLLLLAALPLWAAAAAAGHWAFGSAACRAARAAAAAHFCACALLMAGVSAERCAAVARGARALGDARRRRRRARRACAAAWAAAALLGGLPEALLSRARGPPGRAACTAVFPAAARGRGGARLKAALLGLRAALGFALPVAVVAACSALTIRALRRAKRAPRRRRALRVTAAALAAFVLSQLPFHAALLVQAADAHAGLVSSCAAAAALDVGLQAAQAAAFLHSCLHPALYAFVGQRFRRDLAATLRRAPPRAARLSSALLETTSGPRSA
ncbi:C-C chemokine receptor type 9 [Thomomys bottae]